MGRKRTRNKHLPERWQKHHGAFYYLVPEGQRDRWDGKRWYRLGATEAEAYRTWAERVDSNAAPVRTVGQLLDRYAAEHVPTLAPATQRDYLRNRIPHLRAAFAEAPVDAVTPHHVHEYIRIRSTASARGAALEKKVLQHVYSKAREWGVTTVPNPCAGIRTTTAKRTRYVEDWEAQAFYSIASPMLRAFTNFALVTGLRKKDILEMRWGQVSEEGIRVVDSKTGKRRVIAMSPTLRAVLEQIRALRGTVQSMYLIANRRGQCYVQADAQTSGFDSQWQRAMKKALKETDLVESFTPHDLRAKAASDTDADHAQMLLGHSTGAQTASYRRKGEIVRPAK